MLVCRSPEIISLNKSGLRNQNRTVLVHKECIIVNAKSMIMFSHKYTSSVIVLEATPPMLSTFTYNG
jgi:hypothetical protein